MQLRSRKVVAAAGLARPGRFFAMLRDAGLTIGELALADHYDFAILPWPIGTSDVVVTEKDAVKLAPERRIGARVWVAALDFEPEPDSPTPCSHDCRGRLPRRLSQPMETRLLELLVCPLCKGPLQHWRPPQHERQELVCNADGLAFPVRDGIPVMLEGEARSLDAASGAATAP